MSKNEAPWKVHVKTYNVFFKHKARVKKCIERTRKPNKPKIQVIIKQQRGAMMVLIILQLCHCCVLDYPKLCLRNKHTGKTISRKITWSHYFGLAVICVTRKRRTFIVQGSTEFCVYFPDCQTTSTGGIHTSNTARHNEITLSQNIKKNRFAAIEKKKNISEKEYTRVRSYAVQTTRANIHKRTPKNIIIP